jgi:phenylalanyl-tRNA synthetase beta chain
MGGEGFSVSPETKNIIYVAESLDATTVRKTSQRLSLRSESSMRIEKSLDPEMCPHTIRRAILQTKQFLPEIKTTSALTDIFTRPFPEQRMDLDPEILRNRSGINISDSDIAQKLESLGFDVLKDGAILDVTVPSWRATKDVETAEDLIEEVVRLYGFEQIQSAIPSLPVTPPKVNKLRRLDWRIRETLSTQGLLEVYQSSFVGLSDPEWLEENPEDSVRVQNPSSEAYTYLRKTLISNFVANIESEIRTHGRADFFELGRTYEAKDKETPRLALFSATLNGKSETQFYHIQSHLLKLLEGLGVHNQSIEFTPNETLFALAHPAQSAAIIIAGEKIGIITSLHPQKHPVRNVAIAFVEIETQKLLTVLEKKTVKYKPLSPFPAVRRDLSIVVPPKTLAGDLIKTSHQASPLLTKCSFFDEFTDRAKLGELKNLSFHLEFRSWEKTLDESEIETAFENIVQLLQDKFGAELRLEFDKKKVKC